MSDKILISEPHFNSMVLIKSWPDSSEIMNKILEEYLSLSQLPKVGEFIFQDNIYCAMLSPGHIMLFSFRENLCPEITKIILPEIAAIIDVSHSRRGLRIQGKSSTNLLNKGIAINLSEDNFPELGVLQSSIHSIGIILLKLEPNNYLIFSYRSFFDSFYAWVIDSAKEYGYALS